ncbi:MAG TPA: tetratricopeptide repeat protein, partial [Candidatus Eisenbacteria bacterium]|nr:tetratricopeptide repeat protein [Candidatus Eisenbacteria bacterium]
AVLLVCFTASRSIAAGSSPDPPKQTPAEMPTPASQGKATSPEERASAARIEAEKLYADGYGEVEKAKKEVASGKEKDAKKRFGKALKKFEAALERDPVYYQAWNMVGYCARNTGDLKRAFAAYEKCLSIQPDYDEAHEYLGEAYILSGDLAKAKVELAWLRANDSDEAEELAQKIAKAEGKSSPAAPASAPTGGTQESPAEPEAPSETKPSAPAPEDSKKIEKAEETAPGSPQGIGTERTGSGTE